MATLPYDTPDSKETSMQIAAIDFSQSEEDMHVYEERREFTNKGRENLGILKGLCEKNLEDAMKKIEFAEKSICSIVVRSFEEVKLQTVQRYESIKNQLYEMESNLDLFVTDKCIELSYAENSLCTAVSPSVPLFQLILGDCRLRVAKLVKESCVLAPTDGSITKGSMMNLRSLGDYYAKDQCDIANEIYEYAQLFGAEITDCRLMADQYKHRIATGLLKQLLHTATEDEIQQGLRKWLIEGKREKRASRDYERARKKLEKCKALLQQRHLVSPEVCLHLGTVLSHFGERAQAEAVLKDGGRIAALDGGSELAMQLGNALAELYFQSGRWRETVEVCQRILDTCSSSRYNVELLKALFFITNAYYWLADFDSGKMLARYWIDLLADSDPHSKCLSLLIQAETQWKENTTNNTAIKLFEKGLDLCKQYFPTAYSTAYCRRRFGNVLKMKNMSSDGEIQDLMAIDIYSVHYPHSIDYAICLNCLARLQESLGKKDLAKEGYHKAYNLFQSQFPTCENFAYCLYYMSVFYANQGNEEMTAHWIEKALGIFGKFKNKGGMIASCNDFLARLAEKQRAGVSK